MDGNGPFLSKSQNLLFIKISLDLYPQVLRTGKKFGIIPNLIEAGYTIQTTMKITDGLELSAKKVEYLKYLSGRTSAVKTNHLAIRFGVDPSTITKTISELAESGYLTYTPYHGVCLSKKGRQYAEFCVKRHRILTLMLTHFGLSQEQVCQEVSRFECLVSRDAIERMCHAMGHPRQGICGEIIQTTPCPECAARDN